mgnify:CR=1 FL=1
MDRMLREGEGEEGMCMHERNLVVAKKVRGLCGCKRLTRPSETDRQREWS